MTGVIAGMIAVIAGMIGAIAGMTVEKSRGVFVTDLTPEGMTLAGAGASTSMTPGAIAAAIAITARDSAEAMLRDSASSLTTVDTNQPGATHLN